MPARFWILRIMIALMALGFSFFWGRSVARRGRPARRGTGPASWALRTLAASAALLWGAGPDLFTIAAYLLVAASWAAGFFRARRPKKPEEDLTKTMFPDD